MTSSLEQRIAGVEQRLVARERRLQAGVQALGTRVKTALRPNRLVRPALGVAVSLAAAGWLLQRLARRRARKGAPAAAVAGAASSLVAPIALVRAAVWLWPLLPPRWRARARAASTATLVAALGMPLFDRLFKAPVQD